MQYFNTSLEGYNDHCIMAIYNVRLFGESEFWCCKKYFVLRNKYSFDFYIEASFSLSVILFSGLIQTCCSDTAWSYIYKCLLPYKIYTDFLCFEAVVFGKLNLDLDLGICPIFNLDCMKLALFILTILIFRSYTATLLLIFHKYGLYGIYFCSMSVTAKLLTITTECCYKVWVGI